MSKRYKSSSDWRDSDWNSGNSWNNNNDWSGSSGSGGSGSTNREEELEAEVRDLKRKNNSLSREVVSQKQWSATLWAEKKELEAALEKKSEEAFKSNKQTDWASKKVSAIASGTSKLEALREERARAEVAHTVARSKAAEMEGELAAKRFTEESSREQFEAICKKVAEEEEAVRAAAAEIHKESAARGLSLDQRAGKLAESGISLALYDSNLLASFVSRLRAKYFADVPARDLVWEYEKDGGGWAEMSTKSVAELEKAWESRGYASASEFVFGEHSYEIDFDAMTQTNVKTQKTRNIRRVVRSPAHWVSTVTPSTISSNSSFLQDLSRQPRRYQELRRTIETLMRQSSLPDSHRGAPPMPIANSPCKCLQTVKIHAIYQVENWQLHQEYQSGKIRLKRRLATAGDWARPLEPPLPPCFDHCSLGTPPLDSSLNECYLFHGSSLDTFGKISKGGFDFRLAGSGGYYGAGTYFAANACKSHQYTAETDGSNSFYCCGGDQAGLGMEWGRRHMAISRVLLGRIYYAPYVNRQAKTPPPNYDSVVASAGPMPWHHAGFQIHQECVVFDRDQALPEWIIEYTTD